MQQLQENVPLAPLTTIGIGGPARFFFRATSVDEVREALAWARERSLATFVLGGGSNLLISDAGFDGVVIHVDLRGVTVESEDEYAMVKVAAGEPWDAFVATAVGNGWAGSAHGTASAACRGSGATLIGSPTGSAISVSGRASARKTSLERSCSLKNYARGKLIRPLPRLHHHRHRRLISKTFGIHY